MSFNGVRDVQYESLVGGSFIVSLQHICADSVHLDSDGWSHRIVGSGWSTERNARQSEIYMHTYYDFRNWWEGKTYEDKKIMYLMVSEQDMQLFIHPSNLPSYIQPVVISGYGFALKRDIR